MNKQKLFVVENNDLSEPRYLDGFRGGTIAVWKSDFQNVNPLISLEAAAREADKSGGHVVQVHYTDACILKKTRNTTASVRIPKTLKQKVAAMRETLERWPCNYIAGVTDKFEGFICNASYAHLPCGCKVIGNGTLIHPLSVKLCKTHKVVKIKRHK